VFSSVQALLAFSSVFLGLMTDHIGSPCLSCENIAAMPSVTELLREGKTPEDMMNLALAGFNPNVLDEREVQYKCDCSEERTEEMLLSLGRKELEKLRDEDPDCEVVCHFCHTKYHFDLNKLVEKAAYKKEKAETQEPEA